MFYYVYPDKIGEFRWRLYASNNRVIADSGEGYKNKIDCYNAVDLVKASQHAPVREAA